MTSIEIHVITACVVLLALEPAGKILHAMRNWVERRAIHRRHLESL